MNLKINLPSSNSFQFYATNTHVPIQHTRTQRYMCTMCRFVFKRKKITEQLSRRKLSKFKLLKLSNITMHILQHK